MHIKEFRGNNKNFLKKYLFVVFFSVEKGTMHYQKDYIALICERFDMSVSPREQLPFFSKAKKIHSGLLASQTS